MCIGIFLCMLDTTVMNIALPAIQEDLSISLNSVQWALNIYIILFASLSIPLTALAEKFGRNRAYIVSLFIFILGSLISSLSTTLPLLITGRAIQAVGAAIIFPLSMTIGINLVTLEKRTKVIAALGVTQGLASALGPTIGGILTQFLGWRWIFLVNIPLIAISFIICISCLNLNEITKTVHIDFIGAILCVITLFSLTLALVKAHDWGWTNISIIGLFCFFSCFFHCIPTA
ncbi:MFS transporter [Alloscardovia theropitheci]|uniref:MFS transporter n=1 Tax=Alloscardovia theropitheci TaxID=2496842 RepID=UPI0023EA67B5|nr:MFS transporter [Alloscardovia theropitheci]